MIVTALRRRLTVNLSWSLALPSRLCNLHPGKDKTQALSRTSRLSRHNSHPFTQDLNDNVVAGHVINNPSIDLSFPEDNSKAFQLARINAAIVTMQNSTGKEKVAVAQSPLRLPWHRKPRSMTLALVLLCWHVNRRHHHH